MSRTVNTLIRVPLAEVRPGPNVRTLLTDIDELALSIKTVGLLKPLMVCEDGEHLQIIDGHRRHAAARRAGLAEVDVIVRAVPPPHVRLAVQVALASHSAALDPMTEARTIHELMFTHLLTREQIAASLGRSPAWVRDRLSLLRLTPTEQQEVTRGRMSMVEARMRLQARPIGGGSNPPPPKAGLSATQAGRAAPAKAHCRTCRCRAGAAA